MLRMRHQAEHVEAIVGDTRDRAHRAVGIRILGRFTLRIYVAEDYLPALFHLKEFAFRRDVASFPMLDRQREDIALARRAGKRSLRVFDSQMNPLANERQRAIASQRAGNQMRFAQNLKAVADADYQAAVGRELRDAAHDRREARDRAASQMVAVAEASRQHDT